MIDNFRIIPYVRQQDSQGSGEYLAPRGRRVHNGIDIACIAGSGVLAVSSGKLTKIGYPYNPSNLRKGHLRYVQVTTEDNYDVRYFYVKTGKPIGSIIEVGDMVGISQGLASIYRGITDHFHFEVKQNGEFVNPYTYLDSLYN